MKTKCWSVCWQLRFVVLLTTIWLSSFNGKALAQSTPSNIQADETLGTESSQIIQNFQGQPIEFITSGATRGINLFHSFREFNVSEGRGAYFFSPSVDIQNILARVTGGNRSEILGRLGTFGDSQPNLFLINPNGIIFGENASLDLQGSFVATTANEVQFGNQELFSATNPQAPALLTVNPSALLFNQINLKAGITNQSQAPAGLDPIGVNITGLRVPDGKSLLLVGSNINLDGGRLVANGGRVELAGLTAPGGVGVNVAGNALSLNVPNNLQLADISLSNQAFISVFGAGGGDIAINARNFEMSNSALYAGIGRNLGNNTTQAGDIKLNATGAISLKDSFIEDSIYGRGNAGNIFIQAPNAVSFTSSRVFSNVESGGVGKAGNININSGSLSLADVSAIQTLLREGNDRYPSARGEGGNINIDVGGAVNLSGEKNGFGSAISSTIGKNVEGNGGNINIKSGSFSLTDGTGVNTSTYGQGNAGNISIKTSDAISLTGGGVFGVVGAGAVGNGGNINITADSLSLTQDAQVATEVKEKDGNLAPGRGNGGNINIDVTGNVFLGNKKPGLNANSIGTLVRSGAEGNSGSITINAGSLEVTNGSELQAGNFGRGNTGNITINTRDTVRFDGGDNTITELKSRASNSVYEGNAGNISITTGSLYFSNFAFLNSSTYGKGNAGNITINTRDTINLDSFGFISSDASFGSIGNGGEIRLTTGSLSLLKGSTISNSVFGQGNGGNIIIDVRDSVLIDGINDKYVFNDTTYGSVSGIISSLVTREVGQGGNIQITTGSLTVKNNGQLNTSTNGRGNAGNIIINARDTVTFDGLVKSPSNASSAALDFFGIGKDLGSSGNIFINARALFIKNGAAILASSFRAGNAGNIIIDVSDIVAIDGVVENEVGIVSSQIASQVSNLNTTGQSESNNLAKGGNIRINAREVLLNNGGLILADSTGLANAGNITINARDAIAISFDGVGTNKAISGITSQLLTGKGKGGDIQLTTGNLSLTNSAAITSVSNGIGDGGSILINARDAVILNNTSNNGLSSYISSAISDDGVGKGGDIQITSRSLSLSDSAYLYSSTFGKGNAGNITINTTDDISLKNGSQINTATYGQGNAGSVKVTAGGVISLDGFDSKGIISAIATQVSIAPGFTGIGQGGDIDVNAHTLSISNGAGLFSSTSSKGDAGNITINTTDDISIKNSSQINTVTSGQGNAGKIFLDTKNSIFLTNNSFISSSVGTGSIGKGGDIDVNTKTLTLEGGSQLSTAVSRQSGSTPGGRGKAGELRINASDSVTISGSNLLGYSSGLATLTERGAFGDAGNIIVTTGNFRVADGANVIASTFNDSKGGDITINANAFEALTGGQVITNTRGGGNAGSIRLNVKDNITIAGSDPNFTQRLNRVAEGIKNTSSTDTVSDVIGNEGAASGIFANTTAGSTGQGGNIFIDPPYITIRDSAKVSVNSLGSGNAGNITVEAGILALDNQASISAQTGSTQGGNINLTAQNYLLMRRGSQISTTAGTAQAGGDGGNITINTPFLIAVPNENTDITANAFTGTGGNININAQGIFGIEARPQPSDKTNDITASSDFGLSGSVDINSPDNSSLQNSLTELSQNVIDTNALLASSCIVRSQEKQQSSFTITGTGGLPNRPGDASISNYSTGDVRNIINENTSPHWKKGDPIIEPQGVYRLSDGKLVMSRECQ